MEYDFPDPENNAKGNESRAFRIGIIIRSIQPTQHTEYIHGGRYKPWKKNEAMTFTRYMRSCTEVVRPISLKHTPLCKGHKDANA
jgi:hypothetical protein